uniref:Prothymosin alpha-like n=1 Tax=Steinernema glaseri TaxID=37863 RepID=A0A1I7ZBD5_9BILA
MKHRSQLSDIVAVVIVVRRITLVLSGCVPTVDETTENEEREREACFRNRGSAGRWPRQRNDLSPSPPRRFGGNGTDSTEEEDCLGGEECAEEGDEKEMFPETGVHPFDKKNDPNTETKKEEAKEAQEEGKEQQVERKEEQERNEGQGEGKEEVQGEIVVLSRQEVPGEGQGEILVLQEGEEKQEEYGDVYIGGLVLF